MTIFFCYWILKQRGFLFWIVLERSVLVNSVACQILSRFLCPFLLQYWFDEEIQSVCLLLSCNAIRWLCWWLQANSYCSKEHFSCLSQLLLPVYFLKGETLLFYKPKALISPLSMRIPYQYLITLVSYIHWLLLCFFININPVGAPCPSCSFQKKTDYFCMFCITHHILLSSY